MSGVRKPDHCDCIRCLRERDERIGGLPVENCRMVVCSECGNKRCPHAADHREACTGSNELPPDANAGYAKLRDMANKMSRDIDESNARSRILNSFAMGCAVGLVVGVAAFLLADVVGGGVFVAFAFAMVIGFLVFTWM